MRRLRLLVSVLVLVDTMLFTALTPLLPHFVHRYELSKTGAGLLVAADAAGVLALGIPAGAAAVRFGPRRVVLGGLALMGVASLGFAFAQDGWTLGLARFAQGAGSAFTWAGSLAWLVAATPRARRGAMIGEALGAAIFGALLGPAIGATAGALGVRAVFAALAGLAGLLAAAVLRVPAGPAGERVSFVRTAFRDRPLLAAMWLTLLPAFLFGILSVLVPLRLGRAGWGATAIGAVFLSSAAFEAAVSPLVGRISDRRGRLAPLRLALLAAAAVSVALAWASAAPLVVVLVLAAAFVYGMFWAPAMALISDASERVGLAQGLAFGLVNIAWAGGAAAGPAAGGALAHFAGDSLPYLIGGAVSLLTFAALVAPRGELTARAPAQDAEGLHEESRPLRSQ